MFSDGRRPLRVIVLWLLLELIAAAQVQQGGGNVLASWLRIVGAPVVATATATARLAEDVGVGLGLGTRLVAERHELREQLELALARERVLRHEIDRLEDERRLVATAASLDETVLAVRCRYRSLESGRLEVTGGARDGLQVDQPVLAADGIVGRVRRVGRATSWVQLATAPAAAVAVTSERGDIEALAVGRIGARFRLEYIPANEEVFVGQTLLSSGSDGLYPRGWPVARIVDIRGSGGAFLDVSAEPTVDVGSLRTALVLRSWRGGEHER